MQPKVIIEMYSSVYSRRSLMPVSKESSFELKFGSVEKRAEIPDGSLVVVAEDTEVGDTTDSNIQSVYGPVCIEFDE